VAVRASAKPIFRIASSYLVQADKAEAELDVNRRLYSAIASGIQGVRLGECPVLILLSRILSALPLWVAVAIGKSVAWIWHYLIPVRRRVARENVARALGKELSPKEQRRIVRRAFDNTATSVLEALRIPGMSPADAERVLAVPGIEHIEEGFARGKGVILVLTHLGNIDIAGACLALRGVPLNVVAKDLGWGPAQDLIRYIRHKTGMTLIPPRSSREQIRATLERNELVALLIDQHMAPHRALVCEFFGMLAATSPAPARFGFETGATIVPAIIYRKGYRGEFVMRFEPEFVLEEPHTDHEENVRHNTERLNRILEGFVREAPDQWLWMHKRWKVQDNPNGWDIPPHLEHLLEAPP